MRCEEVRQRIQEALDGGAPDATANEHAAACEGCRRYLARMRAIDAVLGEQGDLVWDAALTARVVARARRERRRTRWLAAAAAVLVVAVAWAGFELLDRVPAVGEAGRAVSDRLALPDSPAAAFRAVAEGITEVAATASERSPISPGLPVATGACLLLLLGNGLVIGRSLLARRRC